MAEFIEREKAIEAFDDPDVEIYYGDVDQESVIRVIKNIPAADVRHVARGTWGHRWICSNMSGYEYACSCSVCGKPTYRISLMEKMPNFCPNCGADMREEK